MSATEILAALVGIAIVLQVISLVANLRDGNDPQNQQNDQQVLQYLNAIYNQGLKSSEDSAKTSAQLETAQRAQTDFQRSAVEITKTVAEMKADVSKSLADSGDKQHEALMSFQKTMADELGKVRTSTDEHLEGMRKDNNESLEKMRLTVDEKLQKTLNTRISESFKQVSEQLNNVSTGIGQLQSLAGDVGDLKSVLSNVKTRGTVGEVQLGNILKEVLAPSQYDENVETVPGTGKRVEYALKIPDDDGTTVYLPIDAKFPLDRYEQYQDACKSGDAALVASAWKSLETTIKNNAKDIKDKYVAPPHTLPFGIMFLPTEGLYADVVNSRGLIEELQVKYSVCVAGPSTMAALLSAVQVSYQNIAIQKRADEIQKVLAAVKAELPKYQNELQKAKKQLNTATKTIDGLIATRTNVMERKLKSVTELPAGEDPDEVLGIDASDDEPTG